MVHVEEDYIMLYFAAAEETPFLIFIEKDVDKEGGNATAAIDFCDFFGDLSFVVEAQHTFEGVERPARHLGAVFVDYMNVTE